LQVFIIVGVFYSFKICILGLRLPTLQGTYELKTTSMNGTK